MPPIFKPEVGAEAVVWAATHRRREIYVGLPTWKAILGTKLFPGFGDRAAARQAWEGQMTSEPQPESTAANLFAPVRGQYAAHGRFDSRSKHRAWLAPLALLGVGVSAMVLGTRLAFKRA